MLFKRFTPALAIAPLSVLAQWDTDTNLTIKLFPSDAEDECQSGGSGGLSFTTDRVPRDFTCIDIGAIYLTGNRSGFINDTTSHSTHFSEDEASLPPPGVAWHILGDSANWRPDVNWTNIWFEQRNRSSDGESEEGEDGRWVLDTYANTGCVRINTTEFPWYETSCQTGEGGQCESTPYSIQSIALRPFMPYEFDDCQTWAEVGAAPGLVPSVSAALAGAVAYLAMSWVV